jgi:hypothetical protein
MSEVKSNVLTEKLVRQKKRARIELKDDGNWYAIIECPEDSYVSPSEMPRMRAALDRAYREYIHALRRESKKLALTTEVQNAR